MSDCYEFDCYDIKIQPKIEQHVYIICSLRAESLGKGINSVNLNVVHK